MSSPIFRILILCATAACGKIVVEDDNAIVACALDGADDFADDCRSLPVGQGDGWAMTIRHPDGGFRRLVVDAAGHVAAADGASPARETRLPDGRLEVMIERDRYRLPAPQ